MSAGFDFLGSGSCGGGVDDTAGCVTTRSFRFLSFFRVAFAFASAFACAYP
jgi:hypothetical protein